MLTKPSHFVPLIVVALAFPAVALAASGGEDRRSEAVGEARPAKLAPLHPSVARFENVVNAVAARIEAKRVAREAARAERRARAARERREERERYEDLPGGVTIETLTAIAACESGGDPTVISADGSYRGKYQFSFSTWETVGGSGDPAAAPEHEQDYRAALLYARSGSSPWPVCG